MGVEIPPTLDALDRDTGVKCCLDELNGVTLRLAASGVVEVLPKIICAVEDCLKAYGTGLDCVTDNGVEGNLDVVLLLDDSDDGVVSAETWQKLNLFRIRQFSHICHRNAKTEHK